MHPSPPGQSGLMAPINPAPTPAQVTARAASLPLSHHHPAARAAQPGQSGPITPAPTPAQVTVRAASLPLSHHPAAARAA